MTDIAIRVENLGKQYRIGGPQAKYRTIRETLAGAALAPFRRAASLLRGQAYGAAGLDQTIWALKDVSLEIKRGEVVGIIGRNGAGKTTLLKILSRITEPTEGWADIYGRVASLLEVGTGFHPELTGRENVYLNGAILGMRREEIDRKFDEIVAFAEVDKFVDTPVKHYSSGMYVRLAFAVAAHLEPEILLVDEVLAVGDATFQAKCLAKMEHVSKGGRTILFVSHNMTAIQSLCERTLLLDGGHTALDGPTSQSILHYLSRVQVGADLSNFDGCNREGNGLARIVGFRILDGDNVPSAEISMGAPITFELRVETAQDLQRVDFQVGVYSSIMLPVCHFSSRTSGLALDPIEGTYLVRCFVPALTLTQGRYILSLAAYNPLSWESYDRLVHVTSFNVTECDVFNSGRTPNPAAGPCYFHASWETVRE